MLTPPRPLLLSDSGPFLPSPPPLILQCTLSAVSRLFPPRSLHERRQSQEQVDGETGALYAVRPPSWQTCVGCIGWLPSWQQNHSRGVAVWGGVALWGGGTSLPADGERARSAARGSGRCAKCFIAAIAERRADAVRGDPSRPLHF